MCLAYVDEWKLNGGEYGTFSKDRKDYNAPCHTLDMTAYGY